MQARMLLAPCLSSNTLKVDVMGYAAKSHGQATPQRPTAEREILHDLGLLERFAAKAGERPAFRQLVDVPAIIDHLSTSLRQELDFRHEAANVERMREVLAPFDRLWTIAGALGLGFFVTAFAFGFWAG